MNSSYDPVAIAPAPIGVRRCGICRIEGHDRRTCSMPVPPEPSAPPADYRGRPMNLWQVRRAALEPSEPSAPFASAVPCSLPARAISIAIPRNITLSQQVGYLLSGFCNKKCFPLQKSTVVGVATVLWIGYKLFNRMPAYTVRIDFDFPRDLWLLGPI